MHYHIHKELQDAAIWTWPSSKGQKGQTKVNIDFDIGNICVKLWNDIGNFCRVIMFTRQLDIELVWKFKRVTQRSRIWKVSHFNIKITWKNIFSQKSFLLISSWKMWSHKSMAVIKLVKGTFPYQVIDNSISKYQDSSRLPLPPSRSYVITLASTKTHEGCPPFPVIGNTISQYQDSWTVSPFPVIGNIISQYQDSWWRFPLPGHRQ